MAIKSDNPDQIGKHVFELSGCGRAPFAFVRADDTGGTCRHCGRDLRIICFIRDADGQQFIVGSSCVEKTDDAGMIKAFKRSPDKRRIDAATKAWKAQRDAGELRALIESHEAELALVPYGKQSTLKYANWVHGLFRADVLKARLLASLRRLYPEKKEA